MKYWHDQSKCQLIASRNKVLCARAAARGFHLNTDFIHAKNIIFTRNTDFIHAKNMRYSHEKSRIHAKCFPQISNNAAGITHEMVALYAKVCHKCNRTKEVRVLCSSSIPPLH